MGTSPLFACPACFSVPRLISAVRALILVLCDTRRELTRFGTLDDRVATEAAFQNQHPQTEVPNRHETKSHALHLSASALPRSRDLKR